MPHTPLDQMVEQLRKGRKFYTRLNRYVCVEDAVGALFQLEKDKVINVTALFPKTGPTKQ